MVKSNTFDQTLGLLPHTDLGNAERFRERFGGVFRYSTAKGWLGWDERRWRVLDQEQNGIPAEVLDACFSVVRAVQEEAGAIADSGVNNLHDHLDAAQAAAVGLRFDPDGLDCFIPRGAKFILLSDALRQHGRASEGANRLRCIAGLVQAWLTVKIEEFDCDNDVINCANGTVRFVTRGGRVDAVLGDHDKADLITKLAPFDYDPEAAAPQYDAFLEWAQPDPAMVRYLHQWAGYSSSGHTGLQILHFWYGKGANGKSTLIEAWAAALGDYAGSIGIETFLDQGIKKRGDAATPDLAKLGGVRMLRASEPERGAKLNEALIKAATGGEPMSVRALHKGFFELIPRFKLTIGGNYKPDVPGTDEGIWRRLRLIKFDQMRALEDRDIDLPAKLKSEAAGILARVVAGWVDWANNGLIEPESVAIATAEYRDDSDPLGRFLRDCTRADEAARVQSSILFDVFTAWAKAAGERDWHAKGFKKAMIDKGFRPKTSNGVWWTGLSLTKSAGDFVDQSSGKVVTQEADGLPYASDSSPPPMSYDDYFDPLEG